VAAAGAVDGGVAVGAGAADPQPATARARVHRKARMILFNSPLHPTNL